jgi:hypothetical protein
VVEAVVEAGGEGREAMHRIQLRPKSNGTASSMGVGSDYMVSIKIPIDRIA